MLRLSPEATVIGRQMVDKLAELSAGAVIGQESDVFAECPKPVLSNKPLQPG